MKVTLVPYLLRKPYLKAMSRDKVLSLGILSISAFLKKHGHSVTILDCNIDPELFTTTKGFAEKLLTTQATIYGFSTAAGVWHTSLSIASELKKLHPQAIVVFGGPQASFNDIKTLKCFDYVDIVVRGEGEITMLNLVEAIEKQQDLANVTGITYRKNSEICQNVDTPLIQNLDDLPIPDYDAYSSEKIHNLSIPIDIGRGCPFNCTYCACMFWKRVHRIKSAERIIEEIKYLKQRYNAKYFCFMHDQMISNKKWFIDFCSKLHMEQLDAMWGCAARIDTIDEEILQAMHAAGCGWLSIGIESGSAKIQEHINKKLKVDEILNKIEMVNVHHITPSLFFMCGFPQETEQDVEQTLSILMKSAYLAYNNCRVTMATLIPFPKTPITENNQKLLRFNLELIPEKIIAEYDPAHLSLAANNADLFPEFYHLYNNNGIDIKYFKDISMFIGKIITSCCLNYHYTTKIILKFVNCDFNKLYYLWNKINGRKWSTDTWTEKNLNKEIWYFISYLSSSDTNHTFLRSLLKLNFLRRFLFACGYNFYVLPKWIFEMLRYEDIICNKELKFKKQISNIALNDESILQINDNVSFHHFNFDIIKITNSIKELGNKAINYKGLEKYHPNYIFLLTIYHSFAQATKIDDEYADFLNLFDGKKNITDILNENNFNAQEKSLFFGKATALTNGTLIIAEKT